MNLTTSCEQALLNIYHQVHTLRALASCITKGEYENLKSIMKKAHAEFLEEPRDEVDSICAEIMEKTWELIAEENPLYSSEELQD